MQLLAVVADPLNQVGFHKAVNILIFICDLKPSFLHIPADSGQTFQNGILLFFCQDSLLCKHDHMRNAAVDILAEKFLVKRNRSVKIIYKFVRFFRETSAP